MNTWWNVAAINADGRLLGRLRLPWRIRSWPPPVFRGDRLYAVTTDANGIPFVVRARIVRGSPRP